MFRDNEITPWFYINHNRFALFSLFRPVFFSLTLTTRVQFSFIKGLRFLIHLT